MWSQRFHEKGLPGQLLAWQAWMVRRSYLPVC